MKWNYHFRKGANMNIDKNLNLDDYKEETMKKHNLTEAQWNEVKELYELLKKCDAISIAPSWEMLEDMYGLKK